MARKTRSHSGGSRGSHQFGGDWTTLKLEILRKYLEAYTKALRNKPSAEKPFVKGYIDAFAGTGYRTASTSSPTASAFEANINLELPEMAGPETQKLLDGSARIALAVEPSFDRYIFIDRKKSHAADLEGLKEEFPHLESRIDVVRGDANEKIRELCAKDWRAHRAVLFLDPYGMQVEWETIEAIARTKAIDLWLLFPLGIGVNRLLTRSSEIPESWVRRLNLLLGTPDWREEFYKVDTAQQNLFEDESSRVVKASMESIGRYFNNRLKSIFPGVVDRPAVLRNSVGNPLFLFCFAAANEKGATPAIRIATSLLKGLS